MFPGFQDSFKTFPTGVKKFGNLISQNSIYISALASHPFSSTNVALYNTVSLMKCVMPSPLVKPSM